MDKRKRNSGKGKGKGKPDGGNRRSGNNRSRSRTVGVGDRGATAATPILKPKQVDPVVELLAMLRINPSADGIKNLVDFVGEERAEYFNLGKAVRGIMKRNLTDE